MELPILYEYQVPHMKKLQEILDKNSFAFDLSKMGSGKSIVALHIMKQYKEIIVVSLPTVIKQNWQLLANKYDMKIDLVTINKLRGENSPYLIRIPKYKKEKIRYEQNELLKNFNGLIIVDEVHLAKNDNMSYAAVKTLIEQKKTLLMSGTLIDNYSQIPRYMELVGCQFTNNENFLEKFLGSYSSKMVPPVQKYIIENIFYPAFAEEEVDKCEILAKLALEEMVNNKKVIIGVFYLNSIERLKKLLKKHNPLVIVGTTNNKDRNEILDKFQQPNNLHSLLIANINIICTGINLDDEDGRFPRVCILNPNSFTMNTNQLLARFSRANTKSLATIKFVYTSENDYKMASISLKKQDIIDAL